MNKTFFSCEHVVSRIFGVAFEPITWQVNKGDTWAIMGDNGSGKTLFAETIAGHHLLKNGIIHYPFADELNLNNHKFEPWQHISIVSFQSAYDIANFSELYYQQRFHSTETEGSPLVCDLLSSLHQSPEQIEKIIHILNIKKLWHKKLIYLSSGELRKLLIAKTLLKNPSMLIFDNPFIGLDTASREMLNEWFTEIKDTSLQLLFIVPSASDLPDCVTHILQLQDLKSIAQLPKEKYIAENHTPALLHKNIDWQLLTPNKPSSQYDIIVKMESVDIAYGKNIIQKNINWTIKRGEQWALLGKNGTGKSTLLSYIFADNPQAYSKDLILFDRKRGTGETIWEIKSKIGFTSSEMQLYYRENITCLSVVESGFFDSIGIFQSCTPQQQETAINMLYLLECGHLANRSFLKISSGEQRLILFARALVKNPQLLILDEPFHGLDNYKKQICTAIVESFAMQPDKSLIFISHHEEEIPKCVTHFMRLT